MTKALIDSILSSYPSTQKIMFGPIYHSEYTTEFYLIDGIWKFEGYSLIYHDARPASVLEYSFNGYSSEDLKEPDYKISICSYMSEDGTLVILS